MDKKKIIITGTGIGMICSILGCIASVIVIALEPNKTVGIVLLLCCIAVLFSMLALKNRSKNNQ